MKYLERVAEFHELFGHPVLSEPTVPVDRVELRINLLREELDELEEACKKGDLVEAADALCDLQYVLSGAVLEFGLKYKFNKLFSEVQRSNMSKSCTSLTEAEDTVRYWTSQGQECYYKKKDGRYLVYRTKDDKVLKSVGYSKADLKSILK